MENSFTKQQKHISVVFFRGYHGLPWFLKGSHTEHRLFFVGWPYFETQMGKRSKQVVFPWVSLPTPPKRGCPQMQTLKYLGFLTSWVLSRT